MAGGTFSSGSVTYVLDKVVSASPSVFASAESRVRFQSSQAGSVNLLTAAFQSAMNSSGGSAQLTADQTVTGPADFLTVSGSHRAYQATITGSGSVSATIAIEVSNDGDNWITQSTITLSGTDSDTDGMALNAPWPYVRSNITAISGTDASVTVTVQSTGYLSGAPIPTPPPPTSSEWVDSNTWNDSLTWSEA